MSDRQITYLTDALIITCIVQASQADEVVKAAQNVGAQGATVTYARGTGVRERMGLMGVTIDEQKEMVRIIVSEEQADRVFEAMYLAGELDKPGMGIMFMNKLDRIATYIPDEVLVDAGTKPVAKKPAKRKTATRRPAKAPAKRAAAKRAKKMITEIGAFMHKGEGLRLMSELHGDKKILGIYVEAGRTEDLFAFREFGSASENDIVTILVEARHADKIFNMICAKIGLDKPQSGMVFQMPLHKQPQ